jgi:hypothetical protein
MYSDQFDEIRQITDSGNNSRGYSGGMGRFFDDSNFYGRSRSNLGEELRLLKGNIGKNNYNSLKIVTRSLDILRNEPKIRSISRIDNIRDMTTKLLTNAEIIDYLSNPSLSVDSNNRDNQNRQSRLKSWAGFNEIQNFLKLANQLKARNSSNIVLQHQLDEYIRDGSSKELTNAMNPRNSKNNLEIIDTGIELSTSAKIYLRIDVIGGKVDDSNKSQIECIFSGESLGNDFEELTKERNFWELDKNRFYFDMDSQTSTVINEMKETVKTTTTKSPEIGSTNSSTSGKTIKARPEKGNPKKGGKNRKTYRK